MAEIISLAKCATPKKLKMSQLNMKYTFLLAMRTLLHPHAGNQGFCTIDQVPTKTACAIKAIPTPFREILQ